LRCFFRAQGLTWGVFQSYYVTQTFEGTDESVITLVGGLAAFVRPNTGVDGRELTFLTYSCGQTMNATCFFGGRLGDR
jgi:hypothetical protein